MLVLALGFPAALMPIPSPALAQGFSQGGAQGFAQERAAVLIGEIRVEGIARIDPETVRSYMQIRAGEPFDARRIDQSVKTLFDTGLFADVSIRRENDILIVTVVENPVINLVAFEGNDVLSDEDLAKEIQLRSRVVYTPTRVTGDVQRILDLYRARGRYGVRVEPKVIERSQNRVDLVFEIDEGDPTRIRKITFIGNRALSDSRLMSEIQSSESRWYSFLTSTDIFDPDRMRFDEELLRRAYLKRGFVDMVVLSSTAELSPDRESFFLTFTISEGERYRFGEIDIRSEFRDLETDDLRRQLTFSSGDWYNSEEIEKSITALTNAVSAKGFPFIDIRPEISRDRETRRVSVTFVIAEGPRLYVERIDIHGNVRTKDKVIRREFRIAEGDPVNRARIRDSERKVRDTGYFRSVAISREPGSTEEQEVLSLEVEEQSTGSFTIGAGLSTTEGLLTMAELKERNLLGTGREVSLSATLGTKSQDFEIGFTEPYFLERNMSAGVDVFNSVRRRDETIAFEQARTGFGLRLGYAYNDRLSQRLTYRLERRKVSNIDNNASLFVKRQEGQATSSTIGQALTYSTLDSRLDPTEGYIVSLSNDFAGVGGDTRFFRTGLSADQYFTVVDDWVLRFGGELGYMFGIGKSVRIDDRYFIGGDRFRGFARGGIGPRDRVTGDALGGKRFATATTELGVPFGTSTAFQPRGFLFTDAGTLIDSGESGPDVQNDDMIRLSVGAGVGLKTAFGTIRLNFAVPVRKASFDRVEKFSFRFGTGF